MNDLKHLSNSCIPLYFAGEIRCYCNESECISTSYMCKSAIGMCYTRWAHEGDTTRTTQGCVDSLKESDKEYCFQVDSEFKDSEKPSNEWPVLICCKNDMCNYKNDVTIDIIISPKANHSQHRLGKVLISVFLGVQKYVKRFCFRQPVCLPHYDLSFRVIKDSPKPLLSDQFRK